MATAEDERVYTEAAGYLEQKLAEWPYLESPLPEEEMTPNARYMLPTNYGMTQWLELFNDRQKLALMTFLERVKGIYERLRADCEAAVAHRFTRTDKSVSVFVDVWRGRWKATWGSCSVGQRHFAAI